MHKDTWPRKVNIVISLLIKRNEQYKAQVCLKFETDSILGAVVTNSS